MGSAFVLSMYRRDGVVRAEVRVGAAARDVALPHAADEELVLQPDLEVEQRLVAEHARDPDVGVRLDIGAGRLGIVEVVRERTSVRREVLHHAPPAGLLGRCARPASFHLVAVQVPETITGYRPEGLLTLSMGTMRAATNFRSLCMRRTATPV
jgi:hypothetical protein